MMILGGFNFFKCYNLTDNFYLQIKMKKAFQQEFSTLNSTLNRTLGVKTPRSNNQIQMVQQLFSNTVTHKPVIEQRIRETINRKAEIDKNVKDKVSERERKEKLYLQYNNNPFMIHKKTNQKLYHFQEGEKQREINLVHTLRHRNQKKPLQIQQNTVQAISNFDKMKQNYAYQSGKYIYTLQTRKAKQYRDLIKNKENEVKVGDFDNKENIDYSKMTIQMIEAIKEESFFFKKENETKLNIFKIPRSDDECLNPFEKLSKKNFSFNAMVDRISNLKIPIYREISNMGWGLLMGTYKGKQIPYNQLLSGETMIHFSELTFNEMMNIASNRFSPQFAQKVATDSVNQANVFLQFDSEEGSKTNAIFSRTMKNYGDNYNWLELQTQQISDFKKIQYNQEQLEHIRKLEMSKNQLINILEHQNNLCTLTIKQPKLQFSLSRDMKKIIEDIINEKESATKFSEIDKKVRKNKWNKDKTEYIQIKFLKDLLQQKNYYHQAKKMITREKNEKDFFNATL